MGTRIAGVISAAFAAVLWFGRKYVEAAFFDKVIHMTGPDIHNLVEYGPPATFAILAAWLFLKKPSVRFRFDTNDPNCVVRVKDKTWYRIQVISFNEKPITSCYGRLRRIRKNGRVLFKQNGITLPFSEGHMPGATNKTLTNGQTEHLDFAYAMDGEDAIHVAQHHSSTLFMEWSDILSGKGKYKFDIDIVLPPNSYRYSATLDRS